MNRHELDSILLDSDGIRPDPAAPEEEIKDVINCRSFNKDRLRTRVDALRSEVSTFVKKNRTELSLHCNGECSEHTDLIVLWCYRQLLEGKVWHQEK